jgi:hypothetical protein
MKTLKLLLAGVAGISLVGTASAVDIFVAGSNGDRASTNTAIKNILTGSSTFAGTNADFTRANFGVFSGTFSGTAVNVYVSYIGATGGIKAVAGNQTVRFVSGTNAGLNIGNVPDPTVGSNPNQAVVPDFTMSTNFQSTSPYQGLYQGVTYATLVDQKVAAIPMKFLGSKNYPGNNITSQQSQLLFTTGFLPLAVFTGSASDQDKIVFATGRNTDAGQRYGQLTESGLSYRTVVSHFKPVISGAASGVGGFVTGGTVTSHDFWPIETVSGVSSEFPGNSGASTGANLAPYLTAVLSENAYTYGGAFEATAGYYISYLTTGDSDTIAIPNGAVELAFNGVYYSADNVRQGKYTFWLYEHVMYKSSFTGFKKTFADAVATRLKNVDGAVAGILINEATFKVSRTKDGGPVTPNYF